MGFSDTIKKCVLLPIVSVVLFVILVESVLWLFDIDPHPRGVEFAINRAPDYPEVFLKDGELFWRLRPGRTIESEFFQGKSYRINLQGFRGDDFVKEKPGLRVGVLGNSCSFGWGVDETESFAGRLQVLLRENPETENAEVYNFSVPGYTSYQGVYNYRRNIRPYRPDILLVTFAWNDQWISAGDRADKDQKMPPQFILDIYNSVGKTRFYRLFKTILFSFRGEHELPEYRDQTPRVDLVDFKDNLGAIIEMAQEDGIRVILMTSPIPSMETYYNSDEQSYMHERHFYYNEMTREAAAVNMVELIDLAGIFDRYGNLFDDVSKDPFHYNGIGHALAADEIFRVINEGR